jgi:uncharacterized membrane protein YdbT with pleckstrin-like domain
MGTYISGNLLSGERVISEAKKHWVIFILPLLCILVGLFSLPFGGALIVIGIILLVYVGLVSATTEMAVTNKRAIGKTGIIARNAFDTNLSKVEGAQIQQGIIGRILGYGSIKISGTGAGQQTFNYVADPLSFQKAINTAVQNSLSTSR